MLRGSASEVPRLLLWKVFRALEQIYPLQERLREPPEPCL
jgi:hypothetical protein